MKTMKRILILCVLVASTWAVSGASAEDKNTTCLNCHSDNDTVMNLFKTKHGIKGDTRTPQCQSCHGESAKHISSSGESSPDLVFKKKHFPMSEAKAITKQCLSCHEKDSTRHNWTGSKHQVANVSCVACHSIHQPSDKVRDRKTQTEVCFTCHKEQRAQAQKISHHPITEGKVICADCHNPHGSAGPKLLKEATVNETCFTCHAEKRGPFLWEHQPVVENCANCHSVHGSNISPLLKSRPPFLCQQCHNGPHSSATPVGRNAAGKQGGLTGAVSEEKSGRACMNCHSMVHGSNSPSGAILHR